MTHQPTDACHDVHCYSCHVDEIGTGFIVCGECGHLYRTAGDLRRAYRRRFREVHKRWQEFDIITARLPGYRAWWRILTIRVKNIHFCQHCIHDF